VENLYTRETLFNIFHLKNILCTHFLFLLKNPIPQYRV
jgi:hypothetical protein